MSNENLDFYQKLRKNIKIWCKSKTGKNSKWAEYILLAPDLFHLLCKLSIDPNIEAREKAKLAFAITYFISPIDLIPEAILGPIGYVDDIGLAAYVLNSILNDTNTLIIVKHWAGEKDVLVVIQEILKVANQMIGSGLWKKLIGFMK